MILNESPNNDHVERILAVAEKMAKEKEAKKAAGTGGAKVTEAPWSVAERAVALRCDNPRGTLLVRLLG